MKKIEIELDILKSLLLLFMAFLASTISYLFVNYENLSHIKIFVVSYVIILLIAINIVLWLGILKLLKRLN